MELFGQRIEIKRAALLATLFLSTHATSEYLQYQPVALTWFALFIASLLIFKDSSWLKTLRRIEYIVLTIFSALVAASILIGKHIVIDGSYYAGTSAENSISSFTFIDLLAFVGIVFTIFGFAARLYVWVAHSYPEAQKQGNGDKYLDVPQDATPHGSGLINKLTGSIRYQYRRVSAKDICVCLAILFIAWLPYLLIYWPGFVFRDTRASLQQALGAFPWTNHHPVLFTLLLERAMFIATKLGFSRTTGLALYSICQMLCYGAVFAYFISWLKARFNLRPCFCWIILAVFALSRYVATYSIALWKDPLFTSAVLLFSLMLADIAFSRCSPKMVTPRFLVVLAAVAIFMSLMRNNGIYIVFASLFMVLVFWICIWRHNKDVPSCTLRGTSLALALAIALAYTITGPVYTALGIEPAEMVESVGVPLNQMARVAALGGTMSESDKEYLNSILPLEQYVEKYRPTCTDLLKLDSEFNDEALESGDFWAHWWSMLLKNPKEYFEAWVLQTYGFWTFNEPTLINYNSNIIDGSFCKTDELSWLEIELPDYLAYRQLHRIFSYNDHSIPEGLIFWALVYLALVLVLSHKWTWLLALVPSGALMLTLFIASPIWYWPRYGCLIQFLLPLYLAMFCALRNSQIETS